MKVSLFNSNHRGETELLSISQRQEVGTYGVDQYSPSGEPLFLMEAAGQPDVQGWILFLLNVN